MPRCTPRPRPWMSRTSRKPGRVSLVDVLFHDRRDVAGREGVEVERAFDGNPKRVLILHSQSVAGFS